MGLKYIVHRTDANQHAIIDDLEKCGVQCWRLGGKGNPDVLTLWQGKFLPLEIKTATGKLRESQREIPWPVVRTFDEAAIWIGLKSGRA